MSTFIKWVFKRIILFVTNLNWKQIIEIGIYIKNYDEIEMRGYNKYIEVLKWIVAKGYFHLNEKSSTLNLAIELILRYTRSNPKEFKITQ